MTHVCTAMGCCQYFLSCFVLFYLFAWEVERTKGDSCLCTNSADCNTDRIVEDGKCNKENVAFGKVANMTERYSDTGYGLSGPACVAVNGNTNTKYLGDKQLEGPRCIHSRGPSGWWQVDLGRNYTISSISVYGRTGEPTRMPAKITVNRAPCYQRAQDALQNDIILNACINNPLVGRFVNLSTTSNYLNICQVQVWVQRCSCISENTSQCVSEDNCNMENVAFGKEAYMSSVKDAGSTATAKQACVAVDGDKGMRDSLSIPSQNCVISGDNDDFPWWEVDLGHEYSIKIITVYTTSEFWSTMAGVQITVDSRTCYNFSSSIEHISFTNIKCSQALSGQIVTLYSGANNPLVLCEVQIWVCKSGLYGDNCTQQCGKCLGNANCNPENGICTIGCQSDFGGALCQECKSGYYNGSSCVPCGHCNNSVCNNATGICSSGCAKGWQMPKCTGCEIGFYGQSCNVNCGHCFNISGCNPITGKCDAGCDMGFTGELCKECDSRYYYNVSTCVPCGQCRNDAPCNNLTGSCSMCKNGWQFPKCNACDDKHFGENCSAECGHCFNATCNKETGQCPKGCEAGWRDVTCKEVCPFGFYGRSCSESCGNCLNMSMCSPVNGSCNAQCARGYKGDLCTECDFTYYANGSACKQCGHCSGSTCNNMTGVCMEGCQTGWRQPACDSCNDTYYGPNCSLRCDHCLGGFCHPESGNCSNGCEEGWQGSSCKQAQSASIPNDNSVAGIAGGVTAAVVVVIVSLVIIIFIRRRQLNKKKGSESETVTMDNSKREPSQPSNRNFNISTVSSLGKKPRATVKPQAYIDARMQDSSDSHVYSNAEKDTNLYRNVASRDNTLDEPLSASYSVKVIAPNLAPNSNTDLEIATLKNPSANSRDMWYENVVPVISERPAIPAKPVFTKVSKRDTVIESDVLLDDSDALYNNEDIYSTFKPMDSIGLTDSLQSSLLVSLASGELSKLFQDLPKGMVHPHTAGVKQENLRKNRFKSLCPYDRTRVILQRSEEDTDTDYINASYINGYQRERAYIAAQGPREHTVDDMWLMVWQENVTQIVMLTKLKEDGKEKCAEYWPATGTTQTYGHVIVTCAAVESRADFVIRTFSLKLQGKPFQRQVEQYQYLTWPDHGIPAAPCLVNFWWYVKVRALTTVPLLVHCSAGIGRTGTYVALDIAMQLVGHGHDVNVHKIVADLREDRSSMVQSESQYKFLYEVILEACTNRSTRINLEQLQVKVTRPVSVHEPNPVIDKEFKMFQLMGRFVPKRSFNMASDPGNIGKNRNNETLPDDSHLAYVSTPIQGRNMFINAVFLSSFKHQNDVILTQLPLPDTLVDIWSLIDDKDVNMIVSIGSKNESKLVENYCQYWPKTAGDKLTIGPYTIEMTSSTIMNEHLISHQLSLKKQNRTRILRLFRYNNWMSDVPEETSCLIQLMETLNECRSDKNGSPLLVQCIDGATKSGLFCVLWELISRMSHDQEIDIYLAARHVQIVRPQAITSEVQYRYCYKVAQDFQRQFGVYQNT